MRVTREADYAIRCVLHLASRPERQAVLGELVSAQAVPRSFGAKILQKLVRAGIVKSTKGTGGGLMLARPPEEITLFDVYETVSGPLAVNRCVEDPGGCARSGRCQVHPVWMDLNEDIAGRLRSWNFKELVKGGSMRENGSGAQGRERG